MGRTGISERIIVQKYGGSSLSNSEKIQKIAQSIIKKKNTGDLLVIAGKGHEQGQIFNSITVPFSDAEVAEKAALNRNSCVTMS